MLNKLRRKFILLAILSVIAVLLLLMGTVNSVNYRSIVHDADEILSLLAENGGSFPQPPPMQTQKIILEDDEEEADEQPFLPDRRWSAELPYESRYFSVEVEADGKVKQVNTGRIAAVNTEEAIDFAQEIWAHKQERGFVEHFRYRVVDKDQNTLIIFLDCRRGLETFRNFLGSSVLISGLGTALVLALLLIFSGRIVKPVAESYEKQKRFITDAGHEIKTPLAIIQADADVLAMDIGDNEWLDDIRGQCSRLSDLTERLTYLSRMEEGERLRKTEFELSAFLSEGCKSFLALAMAQNKRIHSFICPGIRFVADQQAIGQLLSILLDNALKYSPEGGGIEVGLTQDKRGINFWVKNDCQLAITENQAKRLFDRFYRTDASRNSATGGYGIGLSIAKAIVEQHNGVIKAEAGVESTQLLILASFPN